MKAKPISLTTEEKRLLTKLVRRAEGLRDRTEAIFFYNRSGNGVVVATTKAERNGVVKIARRMKLHPGDVLSTAAGRKLKGQ